ncbi:MAG: molybdopterin synthase sulfur carrier subunit [Lysobacterales bacterium]|jgi:MoaD family protein|nr:MAG: molybdopterin synthase sulfur carrier subunit [Xanthomonadales bacterium]
MRVTIQYFAALREAAGRSEESLDTAASDLDRLLHELRARHGFALAREDLRVGRNGRLADWRSALCEGDRIAIMPRFSGL